VSSSRSPRLAPPNQAGPVPYTSSIIPLKYKILHTQTDHVQAVEAGHLDLLDGDAEISQFDIDSAPQLDL
jgi:hypothetical protein